MEQLLNWLANWHDIVWDTSMYGAVMADREFNCTTNRHWQSARFDSLPASQRSWLVCLLCLLQMAFRMRSSKYRHVYGAPVKKEQWYECIKITKNAHDSNFCAINPKFIAVVTECAGGGAFLVLPLERVGILHTVQETFWEPFQTIHHFYSPGLY